VKHSDRKTERSQEAVQQPALPLAEFLREDLHDFVVLTGLETLQRLLEEERTAVCGPRYRHDPQRRAHRGGSRPSQLALGGRQVQVKRPRARTTDHKEVELPSWKVFSARDPLSRRAVEQMVLGVSTRHYCRSLEPLPERVKERGTSKSAVSRRFVRATKERLEEVVGRPLEDLDLAVLMIDGIEFADHVVLVVLGIDTQGRKHVLGLREGATENSAACKALLGNLRERGLRTDRAILVVIDGSKALRKAVRDIFGDKAAVQRCQEHKKRNVLSHLPPRLRPSIKRAMNEAYQTEDEPRAKKLLENLARRLEEEHPGAASSLREGLEETLTVKTFDLPSALESTLRSTNPIENLMGTCRKVSRNVKRWRGGTMVLRWMAAGLVEASRGFRRVKGYRGMPKLVAALRARDGSVDRDLVIREAIA
jgi:transposase-like protein